MTIAAPAPARTDRSRRSGPRGVGGRRGDHRPDDRVARGRCAHGPRLDHDGRVRQPRCRSRPGPKVFRGTLRRPIRRRRVDRRHPAAGWRRRGCLRRRASPMRPAPRSLLLVTSRLGALGEHFLDHRVTSTERAIGAVDAWPPLAWDTGSWRPPGAELVPPGGQPLLVAARCRWMAGTTIEPSPMALATLFTDPARTSPTANTPGWLVAYSPASGPATAGPVTM